jgi:hypothetical protein
MRKQVKVRLDDCSGGGDDDAEAATIADEGDHDIQAFAPAGLEDVAKSGLEEEEETLPVDSTAAGPADNGIHRTDEMGAHRMNRSIPLELVAESSNRILVDILETLDADGSTADIEKSDQNDSQLQSSQLV